MSRKFKEFKLESLFRKVKTKRLPYKFSDLKDKHDDIYNLPALTAGVENQGLTCYVPRDEATILKNVISLSANGVANAFYQSDEFTVLQDSYAIEYIDGNLSDKCYLYLTTLIQRILKQGNFGWLNKSSWEKVKKCKVNLPVISKIKPDWDTLQCLLGVECNIQSIDTSSWKEFRYSDIFNLLQVHNKLSKSDLSINGKTPVYSFDSHNHGIIGYMNQEPEYIIDSEHKYYLVFGGHTETFNIVTTNFCVMDNVKVLSPINNDITLDALLYISTVWKKCIKDLGYSGHWSLAKEVLLKLPSKEVEEIDWAYMEKYISEIEVKCISELEAYLVVTRLNDYTLTNEDKKNLIDYLQNENVSKLDIIDKIIQFSMVHSLLN